MNGAFERQVIHLQKTIQGDFVFSGDKRCGFAFFDRICFDRCGLFFLTARRSWYFKGLTDIDSGSGKVVGLLELAGGGVVTGGDVPERIAAFDHMLTGPCAGRIFLGRWRGGGGDAGPGNFEGLADDNPSIFFQLVKGCQLINGGFVSRGDA